MKISAIVIFCFIFSSVILVGQTKEAMAQQATTQLGKMTPEQIDAKIKEYGMTRTEAEAKAKEYGIDLETYLSKRAAAAVPAEIQKTTLPKTAAVDTLALKKKEPIPELPLVKQKRNADITFFGYSIFQSSTGAFEPRPFIDDQYVLGEGDVLKISLSGEFQSYNEYTVNSEGRILVSGVGPILVAGYTVEKAKKTVTNTMGNAYSGLVRNPPTIFLDLSVARIRPVRIFMTGEVENPGGYAVSNFGNVFNSLFSVGGPKTSGSLRDVRVIRNNKVIAKVDIYDYLFGSPKSNDVRVNDNDIIFVPLRGKTVTINGEVLRPFTYELLPGENLKKLVEFSGGFRSNIYIDRIQVDRIIPYADRVKGVDDRKIFDIDFKDIATGKKDYTLEDGDIVTLYPILDKKENFVIISGDVKRPGRYQFDKIKTVKDLVSAADGVWPTAYMKRADLMREFPDGKLQMISLDLEKILANDAANNIPLVKKDSVKIYNIYELNAVDSVLVEGHSKRTGMFAYADSMTIGKLLLSLVGLEDSVYRAHTFL
ncbi:MAG: SLBB domain-containing protein, partial [Bacteroidota bacterium]